jgi:hypothetical protein
MPAQVVACKQIFRIQNPLHGVIAQGCLMFVLTAPFLWNFIGKITKGSIGRKRIN